jgi:hypothetical protein
MLTTTRMVRVVYVVGIGIALAGARPLHPEAAAAERPSAQILRPSAGHTQIQPSRTTTSTALASQWLYLRDLRVGSPDANVFPDFDDSLREAFQRETDLFIESQLHREPCSPLGTRRGRRCELKLTP